MNRHGILESRQIKEISYLIVEGDTRNNPRDKPVQIRADQKNQKKKKKKIIQEGESDGIYDEF